MTPVNGFARNVSLSLLVVFAACLPCGHAHANTTFALTYGSGLDSNPAARAAFDQAAANWSALLKDPITVNIHVNLTSLGGTLAVTNSIWHLDDYSSIRDLVSANAGEVNNAREAALLPALPTSAEFSAILPVGWSVGGMSVTLANYHALGGTLDQGKLAGAVALSSDIAWDYNPADGIGAAQFDFVGLAMRQIGHVLGFMSDLDYIDAYLAYTPDYTMPTPLDLFRFAAADAGSPTFDFTSAARYLTPGGSQVFYYGDGVAALSTGYYNGDGAPASLWEAGDMSNLMEPAVAAGQRMTISQQDLIAMDLIGWDVVPEPATLSVLAAGALLLMRRRRS
ncbi:MAG: NF038122 family metalloprotease [Planctomycetaceae bacterium]|nr:PEP-CTERM sorting domain-containing protein [Planctomycetaceae bacterium]